MLDQIKTRLNQIKNPATGATFGSENRWQHIAMEGDKLVAQYNRDGISPAEKRLIETEIQKALADLMVVENILVKTTSSQSQDVFRALDAKSEAPQKAPETQPAQLKTGHGTIGNKKPVPGVGKIIAIGSGGPFAMAAAKALAQHTQLDARTIAEQSMRIAGDICIYTNENITIETL